MTPAMLPDFTRGTPPAPVTLPPVHSAALLQGPAGVALDLHGAGGAMTRIPLTLAALREIAALAASAASVGEEARRA